jgi:predicted RNase H-like nuclease (RuvC/YqgF family)
MTLPKSNDEPSAHELRVMLAQKDAKISTLERTTEIQQEAMNALRKELLSLSGASSKSGNEQAIKKLESKIEKLNTRLKEKDHTIATLNTELENKSLHVMELASELRAVEEEMILRSSAGGRLDSLEDEVSTIHDMTLSDRVEICVLILNHLY